jgi:hypothetical protein
MTAERASRGELVEESSRRKRSSGEREASAISALMPSSMDGRRPFRRGRAVLLTLDVVVVGRGEREHW